jgi:hypothetical protein
MEERSRIIEAAKSRYDAYDSRDWEKAYFDEHNGGFNVYHKRHRFAKTAGGGDAEKIVGKMLAILRAVRFCALHAMTNVDRYGWCIVETERAPSLHRVPGPAMTQQVETRRATSLHRTCIQINATHSINAMESR